MKRRTLFYFLLVLYILVIPWYLPPSDSQLFAFPLWILIVFAVHFLIASSVTIYLLSNSKTESELDHD